MRWFLVALLIAVASGSVNLSTGSHYSCLAHGEQVRCWGVRYRLGQGTTINYGSDPRQMETLAPIMFSSALGKAKKVFSGSTFSCVLFESGKIACFGANYVGQLGTDTDVDFGCNGCAAVNTLSGITFNAVTLVVESMSLGVLHACALFTNGKVIW